MFHKLFNEKYKNGLLNLNDFNIKDNLLEVICKILINKINIFSIDLSNN